MRDKIIFKKEIDKLTRNLNNKELEKILLEVIKREE